MSRNPYDPRELGVAAGTSADPFNLGLTEKGAKHFRDATQALERTSKSGGMLLVVDLFKAVDMFSSNPLVSVVLKFWQTMQTIFNAGFADAAGDLQKFLFNERNIEIMQNLAEKASKNTEAFGKLTDKLEDAEEAATKYSDTLEKQNKQYGIVDERLKMILDYFERFNMLTGTLGSNLAILLEGIEAIERALGRLGGRGDDGGGGGGTPFDPFDIIPGV